MTATQQMENDLVVRLLEVYREKGDRRAIERIYAIYEGMLNHIVGRYWASSSEPYEDLLQVGRVGLIKAINGYKFGSAAKFSSYAYARIEGELQHHLRDAGLVKRPRWARSLYAKISEATSSLTRKLGRPPLLEEIAREVNVTPEGVAEVMKLFSDTDVASLNEQRNGGGEKIDLSAVRSLQYETFSLPIEERILLEQSLESLTELQRRVVYLFFYKDLSQTEIGRRLGLPQRKISRIVASAVKSLAEKMDR